MKLLIISPNYPFPADKGERIRTNNIVQLLQDLGCQIDLLCVDRRTNFSSNELSVRKQRIYSLSMFRSTLTMVRHLLTGKSLTSARFYHQEFETEVARHLAAEKYQMVIVFSSAFDYLIPILKKNQVKVFWDLIDFDSLKWKHFAKISSFWKALIFRREAALIFKAETKILNYASRVSLISQREINRRTLSAIEQDKTFVLPHIAWEVSQPSTEIKRGQIIFTGQMDYLPNIRAVRFFDRNVMPALRKKHLGASFVVAGRSASPALISSAPKTYFTGEVPDILKLITESEIVVVPLFDVFGVPSKVLEAMIAGVPLIVTSEVAETIGVRHQSEVLIADTADQYIEQIDLLLNTPQLGAQLTANARSFLEANFSRVKIRSELAAELQKFIS